MLTEKKRVLILLLAGLLCLAAGCRRNQPVQEDPGIDASTRTHIEKAAEQIHEDLMGLTAQSDQKRISPSVEAPVMGPLAQPVTLKWAGPALPAIENVARMIGYTVDVRGNRARPMPVISINVAEKKAISVLEDKASSETPAPPATLIEFDGSNSVLAQDKSETGETWAVESGSLYTQMTRWTERARYQLVWKADKDLTMQTTATFTGSFMDAVRKLFAGLNKSGHGLRVTFYQSNNVMEVRGE